MERRRLEVAVPQLFLGLLALAVAAVWVAHIVSGTVVSVRRNRDTLTITGSAHKPITSNLVQWSLDVSAEEPTPEQAARTMRRGLTAVEGFLFAAGVPRPAVAEQVVDSEKIVTRISKHQTRTSYRVSQGLEVSTTQINVVARASTQLAVLLERGIDVSADPLAYISTDLATAKIQALEAATADARRRAEVLVGGLGGKLGPMLSSSLGVYQVTPRDSTDVSNYGINDTTSRDKDVTAVVSATFAVKR
jgi:hypothetical protein